MVDDFAVLVWLSFLLCSACPCRLVGFLFFAFVVSCPVFACRLRVSESLKGDAALESTLRLG